VILAFPELSPTSLVIRHTLLVLTKVPAQVTAFLMFSICGCTNNAAHYNLPIRKLGVFTSHVIRRFADFLRSQGLHIDEPIIDGVLHRVPADGDRGRQRSGAYVGYLDARPAGFAQNFRAGTKQPWRADTDLPPLTDAERQAIAAKKLERLREQATVYERAARDAQTLWDGGAEARPHPYLVRKQVASHGLRVGTDGRLMVPLRDIDGKLWSLQHISANGFKQFLEDGRVTGCYHAIGDMTVGPIAIAAGYSTAATVHDLTGLATVAAFSSGNLPSVARTLRAAYPRRQLLMTADNDHQLEAHGKPNVGAIKAKETAEAVNGAVLLPRFEPSDPGTDWNDIAVHQGKQEARRQLKLVMLLATHTLSTPSMQRTPG